MCGGVWDVSDLGTLEHVPSSVPVGAVVLVFSRALRRNVFLCGSWSGIHDEVLPQICPLTVGERTEPCEGRGMQLEG